MTVCDVARLAPQTRYALLVLGLHILGELFMPPYTPVTSKAQSRKLFALANRGEIAKSEAEGKTRAADFSSLPERKGSPRGAKRGKRAPARRRPR